MPRAVPTVTCFVSSLPHGSPFKISLHTWQPPVPSLGTQDMETSEHSIFFEARVLVDGVCMAGFLFKTGSPSPQVIGESKDARPVLEAFA